MGGNEGKRKSFWVAWQKVCREKDEGGLSLKDLRLFNIALLGKWLWRVRTERRALWVKVLHSKYGDVNEVLGKSHRRWSRWWLDISSLEEVGLRVRSPWFSDSL